MSCDALKSEDLVAYLDGELPQGERERVSAHVAACAECAREAELLRVTGDAVAGLPRHDPGAEFATRVVAAANSGPARRGSLLRMWPAAAAAAVLVAALFARTIFEPGRAPDAVLTAAEERDIAADLYVLTNLDTLETVEPDELISLVEELDLLEGLEPELSGLYAVADEEDGG